MSEISLTVSSHIRRFLMWYEELLLSRFHISSSSIFQVLLVKHSKGSVQFNHKEILLLMAACHATSLFPVSHSNVCLITAQISIWNILFKVTLSNILKSIWKKKNTFTSNTIESFMSISHSKCKVFPNYVHVSKLFPIWHDTAWHQH